MKNRLKLALAGTIALGLLTITGCSWFSNDIVTDPSMTTLRYESGATQGAKFKECIDPGVKLVTNDTLYPYPNSQREDVWDSDNYNKGSNSADHDDLAVPAKGGVLVYFKMKASFFLNTECDVLRTFHEKIGKTRKAYFNDNGTYGDGWIWAMDNYISSAISQVLKPVVEKYTPEQLWLSSKARDEVAAAVLPLIQPAVDAGMEGSEQFYKDISLRIIGVTPDAEFVAQYKERILAQKKAETAELNKKARITEAQANAAVLAAEIKGYGGFTNWLKNKLVDKGGNPYQPGSALVNQSQ